MAKESEKFIIMCSSNLTSIRLCSPTHLEGLMFKSFPSPLLKCLVFLDGSGPGPANKKAHARTHTHTHKRRNECVQRPNFIPLANFELNARMVEW